MKLSDNSSKLILSAALFALAGSILIVSGSGQAQGATSPTATDKAITTLKTQMKALQQRVNSLEQAPGIAKGEQGDVGPVGPVGPQGAQGLTGATGSVSGLRTQLIDFLSGSSFGCPGFGTSKLVVTDVSVQTTTDWNTYKKSISSVEPSRSNLQGCSVTVYTK